MFVTLLVCTLPLASGDTPIRTPSARDAWGGPRTDHDQTLSDRVVIYDLQGELDVKAHTVHGHEKLAWTNRSALPVSTVYFHLYLNAFSSHASTMAEESAVLGDTGRGSLELDDDALGGISITEASESGHPVQSHFVHPDGGAETDHTVLAVDLPTPIAAHATAHFDIGFDSILPKGSERSGYRHEFYLVAQWFPKIGVLELPGERGATEARWNVHEYHLFSEFYADFGSFDARLTVPDGYQVAAVGELIGEPEKKNGTSTFHFHQDDVHDFAWMAARDYAPPLHATWRNGVRLMAFFPEEYRAAGERCLATSLVSLDDFSNMFFLYPYRTLTCVVPPYGASDSLGGMEYPTFFTSDVAETVPPNSAERYIIDITAEHEFGHGYFYGIIGSNEFEEPVLDEGLNEYWDYRFFSARGQNVDAALAWMLPFGLGLHPAPNDAVREGMIGERGQRPDSLAGNAWHVRSTASYALLYDGTATVLNMLEKSLPAGDLDRGMRAYVQLWRFRHPSVADLQSALAANTTEPEVVNEIFDDFIYGSKAVDDRVASVTSRELVPEPSLDKTADVLEQEIAAARKANPHPYPYLSTVTVERRDGEVPQTLRVEFEDGAVEVLDWPVGERWHRFSWTKSSQVLLAQLDPDARVSVDVNKLDDGRTRKANWSALRYIASLVGTALQLFFGATVTL